ncbi:ATP-binding cassette domain-containing protein [Tumebacillus sp. ITR2]|uniref:ATP-binding cassette domain-containing protein n=1 Tax=Tumebacillus amylolyticus TaxID=2801339 RepID=A0ABS1J7W2_9BACL|nr:ATP-binding cassette domain-containing protein [Tumebacillus amylolyticus]MBL0386382.1 ATP-binding cassette domain-containing protein [Tumebacillus amylolyticus]
MSNGIVVNQLTKQFKVHEREAGLRGALHSLIKRSFRTVTAVDNISFAIEPGEIVGFLGPNGAGKTTTMKMLSGLLHPSDGTVDVGGYIPFEQKDAFKKRITLVMGQKSQLIWDIPASETFLINQAIYEIPDAQYRETVGELTELLELEPLLRKPVRTLSLGERMKCELAASLLHRPEIIFLDEPTIGLDVNMQETVRRFIKAYNERFNATILLTSHYMADVTALCKRVIIINHGRILFDGDLNQLVSTHAPFKVAKLVFSTPVEKKDLDRYGEVLQYEYPQASIQIPRTEVSEQASRMLADLPVQDFTIEDPPMEDVIGMAFAAKEGA